MQNPALPQPEVIPPVWRERRAPEPVAFINWPLGQGNPIAWLACMIAIAAVVTVAAMCGTWPPPLCAALALACALWRCYLPVRWEMNLGGVTQRLGRFTVRIPWIAIAKFEAKADGVWLFADRSASPLRGVFLYYEGHQTEILAHLQYYLGAWTSSGDTATIALPEKLAENL